MKAFCSNCNDRQPSSFRPSQSTEGVLFEDLCCDKCHWVIASVSDRETATPKQFETAVRPLMRYLATQHHPHTTAVVTSTQAELLEGVQSVNTTEYLVD